MNVGDLMSRDVEFIPADASAQEAAELMGELDVGSLPVGTLSQMTGVVTDRDILYRVVARGLDPAGTKVRDIQSRPVVACQELDSLQDVMSAMSANQIRRMPVHGNGDVVVGWITLADISRRLLVENTALQEALRELTESS